MLSHSRARAYACLLALLAAAPACSQAVTHYVRDRGLDLADVIPLSVGVGYGLGVEARATHWLAVGAGYTDTSRVGFDGGRLGPTWNEHEVGVPLIAYDRRAQRPEDIGSWAGGDPEVHAHGTVRRSSTYLFAPGVFSGFWPPPFADGDWTQAPASMWDRFDLEVGATALVLGLRVAFSPPQLLDFLVGLGDFDPAGDD